VCGRLEKTFSQKKRNEGIRIRGCAFLAHSGFDLSNPELKNPMKKLFVIAAALLAVVTASKADTSYLLIQGPFGAGGAEETFKWKVDYQTGALVSGQDLLFTILGNPSLSGTFADGFGGQYSQYTSGNSTKGASYIDFGGGSLFAISFTLGGTTLTMDPSYSPGWNYYVAGGSGSQTYDNGTWTYSNDGQGSRTLADGSFDAWVYGGTFPAATIGGSGNTPTTSDFASATAVQAVPEPSSIAFMLLGAGALVALRGCGPSGQRSQAAHGTLALRVASLLALARPAIAGLARPRSRRTAALRSRLGQRQNRLQRPPSLIISQPLRKSCRS
jgi:hypothetical protein